MHAVLVVAGIALLCLSAVGAIVSRRHWIRILSTLYLGYYAVAVAVEVVAGRSNSGMLIVSVLLILLVMYAHGVHYMFAPRFRGTR